MQHNILLTSYLLEILVLKVKFHVAVCFSSQKYAAVTYDYLKSIN